VVSERASAAGPTVASSLVRALVFFARSAALPAELAEQALGHHVAGLDDPEHRVPSHLYGRLLERCIEASGDPSFALRLGAAARVAHLGLLGVVLQATANLREALGAYARWQRVLGESLQLRLSVRGQVASLTIEPQDEPSAAPARIESMAAGVHAVCAELAGRPLPWTAVRFAHPLTSDRLIASWTRLLGVRPIAGGHALSFDAAALEWPVQHGLADPGLLAVLQQRLTTREEALRADGYAPRVEAWLRRHLTQCARPTLDEAAAALHLSPRGLQHRLQQEGIGFRDLADAVAEQAARAWLLQGQRVVDVAHALGFSDERAFGRAYRRWTGMTPAQVLRRG
jgi:AraC-like DNA-binding protein